VEPRAAIEHPIAEIFAGWLYWTGVLLAVGWFNRVERASGPVLR
jgi:hypothetical protein